VAAGLVHFSLGTDTNGSIRVPASLCGIYGLKPTFGRLSRSGSHPFVASLDHIGPFARRVCDLASVYDALQGRDTSDGFQAESSRGTDAPLLDRGLDGLRCAVLGGYFTTWCDADARDAVARVAKALDVQDELQFLTPSWRAPRRLSSAPPKGKSVPARASPRARAFEPHSRERLLAGAMIPSAWYIQAQRFRAQARQAFNAVCTGRRADRPGNAAQRHADRRANHGD
jgi:aspartyl-tRNA(Asn)/glutamyl-tRNA(Gln) amidotransferase subunit A